MPLPRPQAVRRTALAAALALAPLALVSCATAPSGSGSGRPAVVVGFYPQQFLVEQIAGDRVELASLAKPGAEPHDMELSPQAVVALEEADLIVYQHGLQPAVDDAVEDEAPAHRLDLLETVPTLIEGGDDGHDHGAEESGDDHAAHADHEVDPHIWLDLPNMAAMGQAIADRLAEIDPPNAATYQQNAVELTAQLTDLDTEFAAELATCQRHEFVTTHTAFGYLAAAYGLEQVSLTGLSPDEQPSANRLYEAMQYADEHEVTTIFYETDGDPGYALTIADEVGAATEMLSPLEVAPASGDYLTEMAANVQKLRNALGCQ
ncbi:metal ABC transporter substrate-binding protein [Epidermidibacterium keratini]|uniref:metal ABC transporter substrate-binding protein n=1 Tax=Epidermidibacterium keratini TaxID=1891644 RepID=UPI001CEF6AFC|nr:metal ABC transporter substrate-binding protein [Epidermidibacterium keratini]